MPDPLPAAARTERQATLLRAKPGPAEPERADPDQKPEPTPARLILPRRALVVVGGLPGAGKSTLLHRLQASTPPGRFSVRDPEDIRTRWERLLGGRRRYQLWRPIVYVEHYLRLLIALPGSRTLILHDTATREWMRRVLGGLARISRRPAVLLWIDVSLEESMDGQRVRGRKVPRRALKRHWRRNREHPQEGHTEPGFAEVHTITREEARTLQVEAASRK
jgi:predicted kinase